MLLEIRTVPSVTTKGHQGASVAGYAFVSCACYVTFFTGNSPSSSIFQYIYFNNRHMCEKGILGIKE